MDANVQNIKQAPDRWRDKVWQEVVCHYPQHTLVGPRVGVGWLRAAAAAAGRVWVVRLWRSGALTMGCAAAAARGDGGLEEGDDSSRWCMCAACRCSEQRGGEVQDLPPGCGLGRGNGDGGGGAAMGLPVRICSLQRWPEVPNFKFPMHHEPACEARTCGFRGTPPLGSQSVSSACCFCHPMPAHGGLPSPPATPSRMTSIAQPSAHYYPSRPHGAHWLWKGSPTRTRTHARTLTLGMHSANKPRVSSRADSQASGGAGPSILVNRPTVLEKASRRSSRALHAFDGAASSAAASRSQSSDLSSGPRLSVHDMLAASSSSLS